VIIVYHHLASVADVVYLAAEGAALQMVGGTKPVQIPFPPFPYHRQRSTIPAAFTVTLEGCRFGKPPLLAHGD
jgi:hypothetical protein